MSRKDLAGVRVLVTRPAALGEPLCKRIEALGGSAFAYPAIGIEPLMSDESLRAPDALRAFTVVLFTSRNAVAHGQALLPPAGDAGMPALAAIGAGTARDLRALGYAVSILPEGGHNSEALLRAPALRAPAGQAILIVRGEGGRGLLAETLTARGARVSHALVYRRVAPAEAPATLLQRWREDGFDVVTAGSVETLQNLHASLGSGGHNLLRSALLVTASERVVKEARALGVIPPPLLAAAPDDEALVAAILAWRDTHTDSRGKT